MSTRRDAADGDSFRMSTPWSLLIIKLCREPSRRAPADRAAGARRVVLLDRYVPVAPGHLSRQARSSHWTIMLWPFSLLRCMPGMFFMEAFCTLVLPLVEPVAGWVSNWVIMSLSSW